MWGGNLKYSPSKRWPLRSLRGDKGLILKGVEHTTYWSFYFFEGLYQWVEILWFQIKSNLAWVENFVNWVIVYKCPFHSLEGWEFKKNDVLLIWKCHVVVAIGQTPFSHLPCTMGNHHCNGITAFWLDFPHHLPSFLQWQVLIVFAHKFLSENPLLVNTKLP